MIRLPRRIARVGVLLVAALALARSGNSAQSDWSLQDYIETVWTQADGVPLADLAFITQTTDGYLWIVVDNVLMRFDGVRFSVVQTPCSSVGVARAGLDATLWVKCETPISGDSLQVFRRERTGAFREVAGAPPVQGQRAAQLFVDGRNRLWIYSNALVRREPNGTFRELARVTGDSILSAAEDAEGTVWFSHANSIIRVRDDRVTHFPATRGAGLAVSPSGLVLTELDALWHLNDTERTLLAVAPPGVSFRFVRSPVAVDSTGAIWIATHESGIARVRHGRVETRRMQSDEGASVKQVFIDREDNVWLSTSAGLHRLRRPRARVLTSAAGQVPRDPQAVFIDSRENMWVIGAFELWRIGLDTGVREVLNVNPPTALAEDRDGRVWVGTDTDIGWFENDRFVPVRDAAGAPVPRVRQFQKDVNGSLWALAQGRGLYQVTPGAVRRVVDIPDANSDFIMSREHGIWVALRQGGVMQILPDGTQHLHSSVGENERVLALVEAGGSIWAGSLSALWRWRNDQWTQWTQEHGLPGTRGVREITADRQGRLWVMTYRDILSMSLLDLDATPDGAATPLKYLHIGALDRVIPHSAGLTSSPRVAIDRAARLHFAAWDSVVVIDPSTLSESVLRPTIVLESVTADTEPVDHSVVRQMVAPAKVQFDFTSLSLRSPETIRFRYRLEGYENTWVEAGGRRQATYGALRPGRYRFHVIGSGSEGVWNVEGASYAFQIVPVFYNTWWFRTVISLILAAAVAAAYQLRVRRVTERIQIRFDERLAERTRIAQDLHDTLLQGALAASLQVQLADQMLNDSAPNTGARRPLQTAIQLLSRVATDGRTTLAGLRTGAASADLAEVLYQVAREQNAGAVGFRITAKGSQRPLQPHRSNDIQHIAREAIVNAYRHAHARSINVVLVFGEEHFHCFVRDDGEGMEQEVVDRGRDGHWGLTGMRERAERAGGVLHVRSSRTAGTEVEFVLKAQMAYTAADRPAAGRWWRWPKPLDAKTRTARRQSDSSTSS